MKAIGIGCFWFADVKGEPDEEDEESSSRLKEHLAAIKGGLEGVDNISNLKVSHEGDGYIVQSESFAHEEESENYYPLIANVLIEFDILMPVRLQSKYAFGRHGDKGIENFHVTIIFDSGLPVTYVSYDVKGGEEDCYIYSPSSAIVFIREYLKDKLSGHGKIEFQNLGPSPFHADFFVTKSKHEETEAIAKDISTSGRGYRTLYYEFPLGEDELIEGFIASNQQILSTYYNVERRRNRLVHLGHRITVGTHLLISESQSRRFPAIYRWFNHGRIIDSVYESILDQKMNNIALVNFVAEAKSDETIDESDIVYRFIEREIKDQFLIPADDVKDVLKMLEDRRQGYIRNTTTIASGLIGGILGASLTLLFGFYSSHTTPSAPAVPSSLNTSVPSKTN